MHNGFYEELDSIRDEENDNEEYGYEFMDLYTAGEGENLYEYLHGYCDMFALALHERYGYRIERIISPEKHNLIHAYCTAPAPDGTTLFIDCRGITDNWGEFIGEFKDWLECKKISNYPLLGTEYDGSCPYDEDERKMLKTARELIEDYKEYYDTDIFLRKYVPSCSYEEYEEDWEYLLT